MKYENIKFLNSEKFRRLTGVKRTTFDKMLIIVKDANQKRKLKAAEKTSFKKKI